ncbi:MAG: family 16 glycoside hydrolase [Verrucomicrobiales bacterium]
MRYFSAIIVFLVVFVAVGIAMHIGLYGKPGIFIWSLEGGSDSRFARTALAVAPVEGSLAQTDGEADAAEELEPVADAEPPAANPADAEAANAEEEKTTRNPDEIELFNGQDLGAWEKTQFGGEGEVFVNEDGNLEFGFGAVVTGVHWGEAVPATSNYELSLEAMKLDGHDFFLALTFPVKESHATFVVGGWGGGVVGISSVDDLNASENETMNIEGFEKDKWYKIRVKVTDDRLQAWIDDDEMVDLALEGRKISLYPGDIELSVPIGIASYQTRAQYRDLVWRNLPEAE